MIREEILRVAQGHFFLAMQEGWAAGVKAKPVHDIPWKKWFFYESGSFRVIDSYCVYESGKSVGEVEITYLQHPGKPIWHMSYGGFYQKDDIPFLKRALMYAYKDAHFYGGRGPMLYHEGETDDTVRYINNLSTGSTFENFSGTESLLGPGERLRGLHHYWGMVLI